MRRKPAPSLLPKTGRPRQIPAALRRLIWNLHHTDWYGHPLSIQGVADWLNAHKIEAATRDTWTKATIQKVLASHAKELARKQAAEQQEAEEFHAAKGRPRLIPSGVRELIWDLYHEDYYGLRKSIWDIALWLNQHDIEPAMAEEWTEPIVKRVLKDYRWELDQQRHREEGEVRDYRTKRGWQPKPRKPQGEDQLAGWRYMLLGALDAQPEEPT